jgi:hypothetical protein
MDVTSVGDPDPEPDLDPHVFGPPGSGAGSISQRYGSGSFPFPIKMFSGLKDCLQKKILTQNLNFFKTEYNVPVGKL